MERIKPAAPAKTVPGSDVQARMAWAATRRAAEAFLHRDPRLRFRQFVRQRLLRACHFGVKLMGLYPRGTRNAADVRITELDFHFADLPRAFDGYTIIHLSDLHADEFPPAVSAARHILAQRPADLCVMTGDYSRGYGTSFEPALPAIRALVGTIRARDGVLGVLGNHDGAAAVEALERLGVNLLINETVSIERGGEVIHVTGTDDIHHFETSNFLSALTSAPDGFKIALVHTAELADKVADAGFDLQLSGHTHGGQICLPGGIPMVTAMHRFRRYARGRWRHGDMLGYTTTGVGASGLPLRFNCPGEVAYIRLWRI